MKKSELRQMIREEALKSNESVLSVPKISKKDADKIKSRGTSTDYFTSKNSKKGDHFLHKQSGKEYEYQGDATVDGKQFMKLKNIKSGAYWNVLSGLPDNYFSKI